VCSLTDRLLPWEQLETTPEADGSRQEHCKLLKQTTYHRFLTFFVRKREQLEGEETAQNILGVMLESNINEGKQSVPPEGPSG